MRVCIYVCVEPSMEIGEGAEQTMSSHVVSVALGRKTMTRCARTAVLSHPACAGRSLYLAGLLVSSVCVSFLFPMYLSTRPSPSPRAPSTSRYLHNTLPLSGLQRPSQLGNMSPGRGGPMILLILTDAGLSTLETTVLRYRGKLTSCSAPIFS